MGSMHTGLEDRAKDLPKLAAYFAERARGGVGLMVTGGYAPNRTGWLTPFGRPLTNRRQARKHRLVTDAVHAEGGLIALQILHAGRYAYHPFSVSASALKAPINPFKPRALSDRGVRRQIEAYVECAALAREGGYDGVEIMGSEGYFINQFLSERTNKRTDRWGGSPENRRRLAVEIVRRTRERVGPDFLIIYRLSMADLVEGGQTWDEVVALGKEIEAAGASIINTGIGWHEARVPTIVTSVPRAAFTSITASFQPHVQIPVVTSNRINLPQVGEEVLARGDADLISMARPFLADPEWVLKATTDRADEINVCIACNQACLDHVFAKKKASCMVNPRAARETELQLLPTRRTEEHRCRRRRTGRSGGGGDCGRARASASSCSRRMTEIGGQFGIAQQIPGKEEFAETIRYYRRRLELTGVKLHLGRRAGADDLAGFDEIVLATGVVPRVPAIPGIDHPKVLSYVEVVRERSTGRGHRSR